MRGPDAVMDGAPRRALDAVSRFLSWISGALTLVLLLMLVAEVAARELIGRSLLGTIELSEVLLVFVVALGAAHAQRTGAHVSTDLVTSKFPPVPAALIRVVGMLVAAGFLLWTAWAALRRGWSSFQSGESRFGITDVPVWPARLILPIGLTLLALQCLFTARDAWHRRHGAPQPAVLTDAAGGVGPVIAPDPVEPHDPPTAGVAGDDTDAQRKKAADVS